VCGDSEKINSIGHRKAIHQYIDSTRMTKFYFSTIQALPFSLILPSFFKLSMILDMAFADLAGLSRNSSLNASKMLVALTHPHLLYFD